MLTCTALVIMMTIPALALFYGGMVRAKNMLSVLMQVFVTFASMIACCGASTATASPSPRAMPFFGGLDDCSCKAFDALKGDFSTGRDIQQGRRDSRADVRRVPGTFAAITSCLIVGAFAERMKFSRGAALHGDLVYVRLPADRAHGLVLGRPRCLHRSEERRRGDARAPDGCGRRARSISRAARSCTSMRGLPGWSALTWSASGSASAAKRWHPIT